MTRELYIQAPHQVSLSDFAKLLADLMQSCPWEKRDSLNYPGGYYFRHKTGSPEIVAHIADETDYLYADFLIWVRAGEDDGGQMVIAWEALARRLFNVR